MVGIVVLALSQPESSCCDLYQGQDSLSKSPYDAHLAPVFNRMGTKCTVAELNNCPSSKERRVKFNPFSGSGAILRYKRRAYVNVSKSSLTSASHLEVQGCNILPSSVKSPLYTSGELQILMTARPQPPKGAEGTKVSSSLKEECLQLCISSCDQLWSLGVKFSRSPLGNEVC